MPQCYNPSLIADQDTTAFGKNSRYMKANNFNQNTLRRVNVLNALENRFTRMRISVMERNTEQRFKHHKHQRVKILDSYKRTLAYRLVLQKHPIRKNPNYKMALNDSYSLHSLRHEIKQMLHDIDPDAIRQKKAKAKVVQSKGSYDDVIAYNRGKIEDIMPKKSSLPLIEEPPSRSPTPPPQPSIFRRSIVGPPLRGLAKEAQGVTLKMVKEKSWMGTGSPPKNCTPVNDLNPHSKLPPIPSPVA